jgi:hypothetical protein
MDIHAALQLPEEYPSDPSLLNNVLRPYKRNCKYLLNAVVAGSGDPKQGGKIIGRCEFSIPESCYIDDTGHFNSVEFNICYNQMMYYVIAKSIKEKLMSSFESWSLDDFWNKQLPNIYIVEFASSFRHPIQARHFIGEIEFTNIRTSSKILYINTNCRYWDTSGGKCSGEIVLAIVK